MRVTEQQFKKALDNTFNSYIEITFKDIISKRGHIIIRKIIDNKTKKVFGFIVNSNKYFLSNY